MTPKTKKFLSLTFFLSWSLAGIYYLLGGRLNQPTALPVLLLYMWIPAISAVIVQKFIFHEPLKDLGIHFKVNKWFMIAWLIPAIISILVFGVTLLFPGIKFTPGMEGMFEKYQNILKPDQIKAMKESLKTLPLHPFWLALFQGLIAGATINALAAFGEELGWRGLLFVEAQKVAFLRNFWKQSLFIGAIWGIWHLPFIIQGYNYPQHPLLGIFMMTLWTILLTPTMLFFRIKSGSVISSVLFHGTLNGTAGLAIILIKGGNDLTTGVMGLPGIIALLLVNLLLYFYLQKFRPPLFST